MTSALPRAARGAVRLIGLTSAAGMVLTGLATGASASVTTGALDCSAILASAGYSFDVPDGKMVKDRPQDIPTAAELLDMDAELNERLAQLDFDPAKVDIREPIEIDVYVHVISEDETVEGGNIPRSFIREQMKVLNHAFRGKGEADPGVRTPFKFSLGGSEGGADLEDGVERIVNEEWYNNADKGNVENDMKSSTYVGSGDDLNIWTTNLTNVGLLGYAYYPQIVESDTPYLDGLVVDPATFPGGSQPFYNEGDTAVHEIGHYLGLAHTFDNGCQKPGDLVKDTPYEKEPYFGDCEAGVSERDSCPNKPGDDPVENFMDYSDDPCLDRFTAGQRGRALDMWYSYRDGA